jgi:hypothetical protein
MDLGRLAHEAIDRTLAPLRFTHLKAIGKSPLHYAHALTNGRTDSAPMRLGRIVHWNVLGGMPDDEEGRIVLWDGTRSGNAWKAFAKENEGHEIVTPSEWEKAMAIADAVNADPIAASVLVGTKETQLKWRIGTRDCTSRPDVLNADTGVLVDLKTTTDASLSGLKRQAWKMAYHAQLSFYADAARYNGVDVCEVYIVGVEVAAPYAVTTLRLTPRVLEEGRRMYRSWFERLMVCEASDDWPAYTRHVETFDVPEWMAEDEASADDEAAQ